jgi:hypothetical protein
MVPAHAIMRWARPPALAPRVAAVVLHKIAQAAADSGAHSGVKGEKGERKLSTN